MQVRWPRVWWRSGFGGEVDLEDWTGRLRQPGTSSSTGARVMMRGDRKEPRT